MIRLSEPRSSDAAAAGRCRALGAWVALHRHPLPGQTEYQGNELLVGQGLRRAAAAARPDEAALVQSLGSQPDTDAVVHQDLQAGGGAVGKDIRMVRPSAAEDLNDTRQRCVGSSAHVHGFDTKPEGVDADHRSQSRSQAAQAAAADAGQTTVTVVPER